MRKLKDLLGGTIAAIYFIFPMSFVFIILLFTPLMFFSDVNVIRTSGFAGPNLAISIISVTGIFIGISLLIPALRKMYNVFPWLYSFVNIFFVTTVILNLGLAILNFGYEMNNPTRHTIFFILMILFVVVGRLAMCYYFWRNPVNIGERSNNDEQP